MIFTDLGIVVAACPVCQCVGARFDAVPGIVPIPGAPIGHPGAALGARGAAPGHHAVGAGPALLANAGLACKQHYRFRKSN